MERRGKVFNSLSLSLLKGGELPEHAASPSLPTQGCAFHMAEDSYCTVATADTKAEPLSTTERGQKQPYQHIGITK